MLEPPFNNFNNNENIIGNDLKFWMTTLDIELHSFDEIECRSSDSFESLDDISITINEESLQLTKKYNNNNNNYDESQFHCYPSVTTAESNHSKFIIIILIFLFTSYVVSQFNFFILFIETTDLLPYDCLICHRKFRTISGLKSHSVIHSNTKPYQVR